MRTYKQMNDLVQQVRDGDKDAFERLYREHVGRVYALCLRLSADPVRAEELTQDVFVRAWQKIGSFRGESAFSSWLHRLTVNLVFQTQRAEKRLWARVRTTGDPAPSERTRSRSEPGLRIDLDRAIRSLPAGARSAFVLHDIEGYTHKEIAELMGLAVGTLKAQLHRARKLLREALER